MRKRQVKTLCACGCGEPVKDQRRGKYATYACFRRHIPKHTTTGYGRHYQQPGDTKRKPAPAVAPSWWLDKDRAALSAAVQARFTPVTSQQPRDA